jgi:hypothetical protein
VHGEGVGVGRPVGQLGAQHLAAVAAAGKVLGLLARGGDEAGELGVERVGVDARGDLDLGDRDGVERVGDVEDALHGVGVKKPALGGLGGVAVLNRQGLGIRPSG